MTNPDADTILSALLSYKNVMLSGAPGTGKSLLLNAVAARFLKGGAGTSLSPPRHDPSGTIPVPRSYGASRQVFRTTFHQNTHYRDMLTGLAPDVREGAKRDFRVVEGILYRASEHARKDGGSALLVIDEINRGPAVQAFGGAIVGIEADKRLGEDSEKTDKTQPFEILDPETGDLVEYALPDRLYILAAMNQADASIDPMDVAFLRRWHGMRIRPDSQVLADFLGIDVLPEASSLPPEPRVPADVLSAMVLAFNAINERISLGRSSDFQIGHGVLMGSTSPELSDVPNALTYAASRWNRVMEHIKEVFFGDDRGLATVLNASHPDSPIKLEDRFFGAQTVSFLAVPNLEGTAIYDVMRAVALDAPG